MGWRERREAKIHTTQNLTALMMQRQQVALAQQQAALAQQVAHPGAIPAGWYADPTDARFLIWWDGLQWAMHTRRWGRG